MNSLHADANLTPGAANNSLRARFVTTLLQYRSAIIQVAGSPNVVLWTNLELHVEWVDIFHRLVEAGYYLIAIEITVEEARTPVRSAIDCLGSVSTGRVPWYRKRGLSGTPSSRSPSCQAFGTPEFEISLSLLL
jgi:hypothetical protein